MDQTDLPTFEQQRKKGECRKCWMSNVVKGKLSCRSLIISKHGCTKGTTKIVFPKRTPLGKKSKKHEPDPRQQKLF